MMTQSIKDANGEQSEEYKTMFAMQQAFAIASAIISTEEAASKALTMGPILGIPMSSMIRAMGYVNVGVIASQAVAGMAHDGIDSIPNEGTWLLDKGERVVDARTNADLKNYLSSSSSGDQQQSNQPITIINQLEQESIVGGYLRTPAGGRVLINIIKENPSDIRAALGI